MLAKIPHSKEKNEKKQDIRRDKLVVLLHWHGSTRLDDFPDDIVVRNVVPQVNAHGLLAVEQSMCDATDLAEHHVGDVPRVGVLLEGAYVEADRLLDDVVLAVGYEEGPVRKVDDGRHDDDAREEGSVVDELAGELDQAGDVLRRCKTLRGVNLACLRRKQHLAWLHAYVYVLYTAEAKVGARAVQHDGAACVDHVGLEKHFVDLAVVVDDFELVGREVQAPVHQIRIHDVDGMVLELAVKTSNFEYFTQYADGINEVSEGREDDFLWGESCVIILLERVWIGYLLDKISTR